ncbi:MAG: hypothetical protein QXQ19_01430, partial [Candidatus Aenigmatarchaeota archaeon]
LEINQHSLKSKIENIEEKIVEIEKIKDLFSNIEYLKNNFNEIRTTIEEIKNNSIIKEKNFFEKIETFNTEIEKIKGFFEKTEKDIKILFDLINSLKNNLNIEVENKISNILNMYTSLENSLNTFSKKFLEINSEIEKLKNFVLEKQKKEIDQKRIENLLERVVEIQRYLDNFEKNSEEINKEIERIKNMSNLNLNEINNFKNELENTKKIINNLLEEIETLKKAQEKTQIKVNIYWLNLIKVLKELGNSLKTISEVIREFRGEDSEIKKELLKIKIMKKQIEEAIKDKDFLVVE